MATRANITGFDSKKVKRSLRLKDYSMGKLIDNSQATLEPTRQVPSSSARLRPLVFNRPVPLLFSRPANKQPYCTNKKESKRQSMDLSRTKEKKQSPGTHL
jgi:hypothetical protein